MPLVIPAVFGTSVQQIRVLIAQQQKKINLRNHLRNLSRCFEAVRRDR